jgi:4-hydroxy-2-oxoheptanedioate aldolase
MDLSASLGVLGEPRHPKLLEAIDKTIEAGRQAGLPVGIAGPCDPQAAFKWLEKGLQFVTLGTAPAFLIGATEAAVSDVRKLIEARG